MTVWESGRESYLVDDIIAGRKTIEGRLDRDKFSQYQPGDQVWLRRDYRDGAGHLQEGEPRQVLVEVKDIRKYASFIDMTRSENYKNILPATTSAEEAASLYDTYYSAQDQLKHGVLAIEVAVVSVAQK
ncbi:MAG: hypothetical protein UY35_C0005G0087 [Candidatus Saccharibacteria bacterium GW2011_GWC2_48_9]|nr:MAG: hypothetical protein UY35_C0005G0087 [Candidatus Saccharibacteria bacterium GW2011_GWC2_48_9]HCH34250.1 hypothetical protein [Candidatus Saccharibacteria bacterium]